MRSKKNEEKRGLNFNRIWAIIFIVLSVAFFGTVCYLNILGPAYLAVIAVVMLLFAILIRQGLWAERFNKGGRIAVAVLSVVLMLLYAVGIYYILNTVVFFNRITDASTQSEEFYVVVKEDSADNQIEDLDGKEIYAVEAAGDEYNQAEKKIEKKAAVTFKPAKNLLTLSNGVLEKKYEASLLSQVDYQNACAIRENFEEQTKIIYTVKLNRKTKDIAKNVDVTKDPFNVYITGIDTDGNISNVARSDVNMILTINPQAHKILLTSIPRDSYVPLQLEGRKGKLDKLTHTGLYGVEETLATVENMIQTDMNYYVKVNFSTVKELVDLLGGIDVDSMYDFNAGGFHYNKGMNHMNGEQALAFARERHSFRDGDFQRNRDQQLVVEALLRKVTTSRTILTSYTDILSAIDNYMMTNMKSGDIQKIIRMQLSDMQGWTVEKQGVLGGTGSSPCYTIGNGYASVVYPRESSLEEVREKILSFTEEI